MPGVAATYAAPVGTRSVLVLGGGVAGLSAGLMLARDGHRVTLVERDDLEVGEPLQSPAAVGCVRFSSSHKPHWRSHC